MSLAQVAALLADPTRAAFCLALLDGRAWTAGELARHAGVSAPTASEHLSRLVAGGLLAEERQGRHRYVRLAGPAVATLIEDLSSFRSGRRRRPGNLRESVRRSAEARGPHLLRPPGRTARRRRHRRAAAPGAARRRRRARPDTRRRRLAGRARHHLTAPQGIPTDRALVSGLDGAAIAPGRRGRGGAVPHRVRRAGWVERIGSGRALRVTPGGRRALRDLLDLDV